MWLNPSNPGDGDPASQWTPKMSQYIHIPYMCVAVYMLCCLCTYIQHSSNIYVVQYSGTFNTVYYSTAVLSALCSGTINVYSMWGYYLYVQYIEVFIYAAYSGISYIYSIWGYLYIQYIKELYIYSGISYSICTVYGEMYICYMVAFFTCTLCVIIKMYSRWS